jgi:Protein of unknown function (DUF4019)/Protein of unknown function (DUF3887)
MRAGDRIQKSEVRRRRSESAGLSSFQYFCLIAFCSLLIFAGGCALKANRGGIPPQAQATIDTTSGDIAEGRYEKIYTEAADEWRQAATLEQANATFKTLKDKLGQVKSRSFHSATEQEGKDSHSFVITYRTSFERADGMETFTLVERDGRWLLARYFVNSDALKP